MRAILVKPLKNKNKVITGDIIAETYNKITLVIMDNEGNSRIKSFAKENYIVKKY